MLFHLQKIRLYTWTSPTHTKEKIVRNEIDYILIKNRYKNAVKSVRTYPGGDVHSDHNPVIANVKVELKKITKKLINNTEIQALSDRKMQEAVTNEIKKNIATLMKDNKYTKISTYVGIKSNLL